MGVLCAEDQAQPPFSSATAELQPFLLPVIAIPSLNKLPPSRLSFLFLSALCVQSACSDDEGKTRRSSTSSPSPETQPEEEGVAAQPILIDAGTPPAPGDAALTAVEDARWNTIGVGNVGTFGCHPNCGLQGRIGSRPPTVKLGDLDIEGGLKASTVRRYMRRKMPRIRHCYEKELWKDETIEGTSIATFVVSPEGKVTEAAAQGLGHASVEGCLVQALSSIQLPKPKGGAAVSVQVPLTFSWPKR